ncbi:MAG: haloacid dehalogenase-like hydrolase [Actinomycetota bacterium]|nr:haloacid dehalogenase-like hydrolase [Actinomycetota bacterium]
MSTTYLFWDIDGTLLDTARAGIFAWEEAIREVLGDEPAMADMQTAGLTDAEIALKVAAAHGHDGPRTAGDLLRSYTEYLPERLGWRQGRVLPNVRENLEALAQREDMVNMLLTGNVAAGAQAKLRHYGLWDFFGAGGAFSVEGADRPSIARQARELAGEHGGEAPSGEQMVVIGDTPHDISCGKAICARTLAVATGPGYDLDALRACEPWAALPELPPPEELARLVLDRG